MEHIPPSLLALFQWQNLMLMILGTFIGAVVGILPGIGSSQAMALLIPLTWKMDITPTLILLISIFATSKFGGSVTAILFNIPGDNPNAVTLIDGFPMAKNGKAKTAIGASAMVSVLGGAFSSLSLLLFLPVMYRLILLLGPAEFFMLALFGLTTVAVVSSKNMIKGLMTGGIGILISTIGYHRLVGDARYTFGSFYLQDGIDIVPVILGAFAMSEAVTLWIEGSAIVTEGTTLTGKYKDGVLAALRNIPLVIRSCLIGWAVGAAPGAGAIMGGFLSYTSATKTCPNPEMFGKGDVRGVIASDSALHAAAGGELLPAITIGIPGTSVMAILLGAFILHGITPGPQIVKLHSDLVYTIIYVIFLSHLLSIVITLGLSHYMEKLTTAKSEIIAPIIIIFCLIGSFIVREYWQDMVLTTFFGIAGYYMRIHGYHPVPLLLGLILGPVAEYGFFEAISVSYNGPLIFITRIPSLIILICIVVVMFWPHIAKLFSRIGRHSL